MQTSSFLSIAESIAGEVGEPLLHKLVEALSRDLSASLVLIAVGEGGAPPKRARALYALRDGASQDNITYSLEGTPCEIIYGGENLVVPCNLSDLFPDKAGIESYIGLPLRNADEIVIGHLAVFAGTPIADPDFAVAVMRIFTHRVEAELRRRDFDVERKKLIAELTDLNQRLRVGYQRARDESILKNQLIGMVAHDLRSPLTALLSHTELGKTEVEKQPLRSEGLASRFEKMTRVATRMADQIEAVLKKARDDDAGLQPDFRTVDLSVLTRIALEANQSEADRKSISVVLIDEGPARCPGDSGLLVPAIDNLISNAIKYTHSGGEVTVAVRLANGNCEVAVSDNGQGMTDGDLRRVFGRFQTLSARPTGGETSTGLGLSNVREILNAHHGTAVADSPGLGKGSTFSLILPKAD